MVEIARLVPEMEVVMVGGKKEEIGDVAIPDNVKIIPYVGQKEVYDFMGQAHLFVAPALLHEPFGRIGVEAMAMGGVPVVSARGGMQSDIVKDGINGLVVNEVTAEAFAKEVRALYADKVRLSKMSEEARSDFDLRFNEDVIVGQFMSLADLAVEQYAKKSA